MEQPGENQERVTAEIERLYLLASKKLGAGIWDRTVEFATRLREKYPDYIHYRAYHKLIGSTVRPDFEPIIEGDFPGEDSVVAFLRSLTEDV
ncbi:MAG TPA: hypothetical protein VD862_01535 [Candidatus Paceibacterota bacterium]|nr:hypothetical protein [Candidatus Paceibacterota bacterium]